jgi:hypothetical protein
MLTGAGSDFNKKDWIFKLFYNKYKKIKGAGKA